MKVINKGIILIFLLSSLFLTINNAISTIQVFIEQHVIDFDIVIFYFLLFCISSFTIWLYVRNYRFAKESWNQELRFQRIIITTIILSFYLLFLSLIIFIYIEPSTMFSSNIHKLWLILVFSLFGSFLLSNFVSVNSLFTTIFSFLFFALSLFITQKFLYVTNYPLSLGWSETSHFVYGYSFYAAITGKGNFFSPYMNHSRYLLLSIPWFFDKTNIISHRFWETILTCFTPFVTSTLIVRKYIKTFRKQIILIVLGFLIFIQGPIYYHLLLIPIILFWNPKRSMKQTIIIIFLTSIWAGASRINWLPMPAAISILVFIIETDFDSSKKRPVLNYFKIPGLYSIAGLIGGLIGYSALYLISGSNKELLSSAFSSPLLFYRLILPSGNNLGAIYDLLLLIIPILVVIVFSYIHQKIGLIRGVSIILICLFFFIGSIIVSAKIGGGSGIHNFDSFILLVFIMMIHSFKHFSLNFSKSIYTTIYLISILLILIIPTGKTFISINPIPSFDDKKAEQALISIQEIIDNNDAVFLGTEQHLILFNKISGLNFPATLEKTLLMEAIMSGNKHYLNNVILDDLRSTKYNVLLLEAQPKYIKYYEDTFFSEENNYILLYFTTPMTNYYHLKESIGPSKIELYSQIQE